jgi:hypothetical protein
MLQLQQFPMFLSIRQKNEFRCGSGLFAYTLESVSRKLKSDSNDSDEY